MERALFICNSTYQILVALWIKHIYGQNREADILISNHMNNGKMICEKILMYSEFKNGYYAENFDLVRYRVKQGRKENITQNLMPEKYLSKYVNLKQKYDYIFAANLDLFTQIVYDAKKRQNPNLKFFIYEDGMYTYSKLMKNDYEGTAHPTMGLFRRFLYKHIYHKNYIKGNIAGAYLFHPKDMMWEDEFPMISMKNINSNDKIFLECCNQIFGYYESSDTYDKKYIFMEESFAAEGMPINDIELLNKVAKNVGKENIMVKIHPRNPLNRFAPEGFTTNTNISIPWEIIAMNLEDISDKTFITVGSSSVLNPILVLGKRVKVYSLYKLINKEAHQSKLLSGEFWESIYKAFREYDDMITICDDIDEII